MVYSSAINIVAKWFPDKKGWRTGFANGGWAYGSVPFGAALALIAAVIVYSKYKAPTRERYERALAKAGQELPAEAVAKA